MARPWPIMLKFLPVIYTFEQCSKKSPTMFNNMYACIISSMPANFMSLPFITVYLLFVSNF